MLKLFVRVVVPFKSLERLRDRFRVTDDVLEKKLLTALVAEALGDEEREEEMFTRLHSLFSLEDRSFFINFNSRKTQLKK